MVDDGLRPALMPHELRRIRAISDLHSSDRVQRIPWGSACPGRCVNTLHFNRSATQSRFPRRLRAIRRRARSGTRYASRAYPTSPRRWPGVRLFFGARPAGCSCRGSGRPRAASAWHSRPRAASADELPRRPSSRTSSSTGRTSAQTRRACGRSTRSSRPSTPASRRRRSTLP